MNPYYELNRFKFYYDRDGLESAILSMKMIYNQYKKARTIAKAEKRGYGREYKRELIESMFSIRRILRGIRDGGFNENSVQ